MERAVRLVDEEEEHRIAENLLRCGELTELCLQLRVSVLRQKYSDKEALEKAICEIRQAKERAWRQSRS